MGGCTSSCGSSSPPPNPHQVDLSHFELLKVVGKGGFGKVNAVIRKFDNQLMALKRMSKSEIIKKENNIRMVWTERNIMSRLSSTFHPFLVQIEHAFQSDAELFLIQEFMTGGDLRFWLSKIGCMSEQQLKFYAAELVLALESMHQEHIVYRDLKPDNLLLDDHGHIRLSDFGLAVQLEEQYNYMITGNAGTTGYLSPEQQNGGYYNTSPDFFSLGVTLYELLHGRRPFRKLSNNKTSFTSLDKLKFFPNLTPACCALLKGLLCPDPLMRLGCGEDGWIEVRAHPFFAKIDWNAIRHKIIRPPIKPDLRLANCSNQADLADQLLDAKPQPVDQKYQKFFAGFDYNVNFAEWLAGHEKRKKEKIQRVDEAKKCKDEYKKQRELARIERTAASHLQGSGGNGHTSSSSGGGGQGNNNSGVGTVSLNSSLLWRPTNAVPGSPLSIEPISYSSSNFDNYSYQQRMNNSLSSHHSFVNSSLSLPQLLQSGMQGPQQQQQTVYYIDTTNMNYSESNNAPGSSLNNYTNSDVGSISTSHVHLNTNLSSIGLAAPSHPLTDRSNVKSSGDKDKEKEKAVRTAKSVSPQQGDGSLQPCTSLGLLLSQSVALGQSENLSFLSSADSSDTNTRDVAAHHLANDDMNNSLGPNSAASSISLSSLPSFNHHDLPSASTQPLPSLTSPHNASDSSSTPFPALAMMASTFTPSPPPPSIGPGGVCSEQPSASSSSSSSTSSSSVRRMKLHVIMNQANASNPTPPVVLPPVAPPCEKYLDGDAILTLDD